jgi:hypothetical protein
MEHFLSAKIIGDDDDGPLREHLTDHGGQERLSGSSDVIERQKIPLLETLPEGRQRRSVQKVGEVE